MSDSSSHSRGSAPGASLPASKRVTRPNPLLKSSEERAKARRKAFLERVSGARDDQRWDGRSDQARLEFVDGLKQYANSSTQILRSDYIAEQRRWEQERQKSAPTPVNDEEFEEQENELPLPGQDTMKTDFDELDSSFQMHTMSDEVEAIAHQEEQELEELLALAEEESKEPGSERWGSDEEDYDSLFMEYLSSQQHPKQQQPASQKGDEDAMDTSIG